MIRITPIIPPIINLSLKSFHHISLRTRFAPLLNCKEEDCKSSMEIVNFKMNVSRESSEASQKQLVLFIKALIYLFCFEVYPTVLLFASLYEYCLK